MGAGGSNLRIQARVSYNSPRSVLPIQNSKRSYKSCGFWASHTLPSLTRGHSSRPSSGTLSGILFQPVRGPQKRRIGTSDSGPKVSQPVPESQVFQDGIPALCDRLYGSGRIPFVGRHHRCVLTCSYCSSTSAVSPLCGGISPLPICGASVWAGNSSAGLYEDTRTHSCAPSGEGNIANPLPRRHPDQGSLVRSEQRQPAYHPGYAGSFRVDHQPREVLSDSQQTLVVPGHGLRYCEGQGHSSHRKAEDSAAEDKNPHFTPESLHSLRNEGVRGHGVRNRGNSLCPISYTPSSAGDSEVLGSDTGVTGSATAVLSQSSQSTPMVVGVPICQSREVLSSGVVDNSHDGRQSSRLGGSTSPPDSSGNMVKGGSTASYQHSGASSDIPFPVTLDPAAAGSSGPGSDGQRYSCSIPKSSGRHAQRGSHDRIIQDSTVGRSPRSTAIGSSHSRRGKLDGRLSQQRKGGSGRVVSSSTSIRGTVSPMGPSGCGLDGIKVQLQGPDLPVTGARSTIMRSRRSGSSLARLPSVICVSPSPSAVQTPAEDKERGNPGNSNCPRLAPTSLVRKSSLPARRRPVASATSQRPALTGANLPSAFRAATFNGVAVESAILKNRGFSETVTATMLKARKPVSAQIYHRVWKSFFSWCEERSLSPLQFSLPRILAFLQRGLELGLALSSLRGQISALSVLFQKPLAFRGPVKTFLQGVAHIAPPYRSPVVPWDLNLVLSVLQGAPFEPIREVSLRFLSWKVAFLVAVTSLRRVSELAALSCKPPFLVFHQDKVVLRPPPEFLPKVVSAFHINEDIVLPSFCPFPSRQKEKELHCLDVVRALRVYLSVSASFRRSDSLFIIPDGPRKGLAASKATIARWIRLAITEAYRVRGKTPPTRIVAHSTRAVGASWAMHHQASASQLCKAATWSSMHTFTKFYRVHTFASADASVGRKVLQAAVI